MTYNIRFNNPDDGPNWWEYRKGKVVSMILKHDPDVLGVQEALEDQMITLDSLLPDYNYYGIGRADGKTAGEYAAIFFKKEKFEVLDKGTFWLSETPEVVGSVGWDASMERICSWVALKDVFSKKTFYVFNAHFDHIGKEAREKSVLLIAQKISTIALKQPVVFMGDLNFTPEETPFKIVFENGFMDSFKSEEAACTFTGFEVKNAECKRIDYIFVNDEITTKTFKIDDQNDGQYFPSDHLPVVVEVSF